MIVQGYTLSETQANNIKGKFYNDSTCFNPIQDVEMNWFLPLLGNDTETVAQSEFSWLLDLTIHNFEPYVLNFI
jgi:hypothetical protein